MNNKHFSPRSIFLFAAALMMFLAIYACGVSNAAPTRQPAATEEPASEEGPEESIPTLAQPATQPADTQPTQISAQPTQVSAPPVIPETRRLTLEYPPKMKAGVESDVVILTLEVDEFGNITPTARTEGNVITGETIQIPNLYETHYVTAEARIDMAGMEIQPPGAIYEPMTPGKPVRFLWSVRPPETGTYRGTVWLHLVFVDRLSGEESRMAVSAQIVEIEAVDFFGFSVNLARTSGVVGSVVGGIIGFPFLEDIIRFIFGRRRKRA